MSVVVTKPMMGVKDGEIHPVKFEPGDAVEGALAKEALAGKWAKEDKSDELKDGK